MFWGYRKAHLIAVGFDAQSAIAVVSLVSLVALFELLKSYDVAAHKLVVIKRD